jgi:Transposase IS200 like.
MGHSYAVNTLHCVWSTYLRKNLISEDLQPKVWQFIKSTGENHRIMVLACGGMPNHVHALHCGSSGHATCQSHPNSESELFTFRLKPWN